MKRSQPQPGVVTGSFWASIVNWPNVVGPLRGTDDKNLIKLWKFRTLLMPQREYNSFAEFWPHYVAEHSKPRTRLLHLVGTAIALGCVVYFIVVGRWWLFPLALIPGYGAAWISHFFIEKNKPATFQYPLWSFIGDYKMIWLMLTGRMGAEVERSVRRAGASPPSV